jgi:hypothetical protein
MDKFTIEKVRKWNLAEVGGYANLVFRKSLTTSRRLYA